MPKTVKKKAKKPLKKPQITLSQRTTLKDVWRQNKLVLSLVTLLTIAGFAGYRYYHNDDASAFSSSTAYCGRATQVPCWKLWTDLGVTKDLNGVDMQGHACISHLTSARAVETGDYIQARVWSTNDKPPTGTYTMYVAFGPLNLVSNMPLSIRQLKALPFATSFEENRDKSKVVALYGVLVDGTGKVGKVTTKNTISGEDNYVVYGYRSETGAFIGQSKPISVATIEKVSCYGADPGTDSSSTATPQTTEGELDSSSETPAAQNTKSSSQKTKSTGAVSSPATKPKTNGT